jgi:hypothetical protein
MLSSEQRQEAFREQLTTIAILWADTLEGVDPLKAGDVVTTAFDRFVSDQKAAKSFEDAKVPAGAESAEVDQSGIPF